MKKSTSNKNELLSRWQRRNRFWLALSALTILAILFFWNPEQHPITNCQFHELTGISCPTCGLSRSLHAAVRLNLLQSLQFHATGWLVALGLFASFAFLLAEAISGKKLSIPLLAGKKKWLLIGLFAIWLISWVINIAKDVGLF